MAMQQCPNGHLYDDEKNIGCPYCGNGNSLNATVPLADSAPQMGANAFPQTAPIDGNVNVAAPMGATTPIMGDAYIPPQPNVAGQGEMPPTVGMDGNMGVTVELDTSSRGGNNNNQDILKLRGWLVCIEGEKVGLDFKVYSGNNTVGRGDSNTIRIDFDMAVSKDVNMIITYDLRSNKFYAHSGGAARNNVYINNQLLMMPIEMKDYDVIEIGKTKLMFRSFCNDVFNWKAEDKAE